MPDVASKELGVARDEVWGVVTRLGHQLLRLYSGFEGREVSGPKSRGPALPVVSVDFWDHFYSVAASSKG